MAGENAKLNLKGGKYDSGKFKKYIEDFVGGYDKYRKFFSSDPKISEKEDIEFYEKYKKYLQSAEVLNRSLDPIYEIIKKNKTYFRTVSDVARLACDLSQGLAADDRYGDIVRSLHKMMTYEFGYDINKFVLSSCQSISKVRKQKLAAVHVDDFQEFLLAADEIAIFFSRIFLVYKEQEFKQLSAAEYRDRQKAELDLSHVNYSPSEFKEYIDNFLKRHNDCFRYLLEQSKPQYVDGEKIYRPGYFIWEKFHVDNYLSLLYFIVKDNAPRFKRTDVATIASYVSDYAKVHKATPGDAALASYTDTIRDVLTVLNRKIGKAYVKTRINQLLDVSTRQLPDIIPYKKRSLEMAEYLDAVECIVLFFVDVVALAEKLGIEGL